MTIEAKIEAARNEVRKLAYGTAEYNAAFNNLSTLTKASADNFSGEYTSIDGDVFAPR